MIGIAVLLTLLGSLTTIARTIGSAGSSVGSASATTQALHEAVWTARVIAWYFSSCGPPLALAICVPQTAAADPFQFLLDTPWEVPCLIYLPLQC